MGIESWTMNWFVALNAAILGLTAVVYVFREGKEKCRASSV